MNQMMTIHSSCPNWSSSSLRHLWTIHSRSERAGTWIVRNTDYTSLCLRLDRSSSTSASRDHPDSTENEIIPLTGKASNSQLNIPKSPKSSEEEEEEATETEPLSWKERTKTFAVEYGRVGICTHLVLSALSFTTVYIIISCGVDLTPILDAIGLSSLEKKDSAANTAGNFLIAYTIYKLIAPLRWPLTFAATPVVMRALRRRGYMLKKTGEDQLPIAPESPSIPPMPRPKDVSTRKHGPD